MFFKVDKILGTESKTIIINTNYISSIDLANYTIQILNDKSIRISVVSMNELLSVLDIREV